MNFRPIASGSSGNLYLVQDGARSLAIECGLRFAEIQKALKHQVTALDGVLVSHEHGDHSRSLKDMLRMGVDVYAPGETFEAYGVLEHHNAHELKPLHGFPINGLNGWRVLPFDLAHDVPAMGFLIERGGDKLLYVTDTAYVPYRFTGLTIIAIEANYSEAILRESDENAARKKRALRYHMSIERVLGFLAANDLSTVKEIHLLHLSEAHSDESEFKRLAEEATGKPTFTARRRSDATI